MCTELKKCRTCGLDKNQDSYYICGGYRLSECKTCNISRSKEWYQKNKSDSSKKRVKRYQLERQYGISIEEYSRLLKKQDGKCLICDIHYTKLADRRSWLSVDHCHETGDVRGLLCGNCNSAIGLLKDDADLVLNAYNYLRKYYVQR